MASSQISRKERKSGNEKPAHEDDGAHEILGVIGGVIADCLSGTISETAHEIRVVGALLGWFGGARLGSMFI